MKTNSVYLPCKKLGVFNCPLSAILIVFLAILAKGASAQIIGPVIPRITVVSGDGQTGPVNDPLPEPLKVLIEGCAATRFDPTLCDSVNWTSSEPSDSFSPNPSPTSGTVDARTSSTILIPRSSPGPRIITATIVGASVTFRITGGPSTEDQEAQQSAANAQAATTAGTVLAVVTNGNSSIINRLSNLYQPNNSGLDLSGVSFNVDGSSISFADIQKWLGPQQGGGAGDDSSIFGDRIGVFVDGNFSFGDHDRTSREAGFDFDMFGAIVGADYRLTDRLILGTALQYASTNSDFDRSGGGLDVDTYSVSLYGTYNQPSSFYLDGILRFGWSDFKSDRNFSIDGIRQKANADYGGIDYSITVSGGYNFVFDALSLKPFARIDYVAVDIDSYQEKATSAGAADSLLDFNQQNLQSIRTTLGGQASYTVSSSYGVFVPTLRIGWQHEYKDNSRTISSSLISNPAAAPLTSKSDTPDRNFFNIGAGVTTTFTHGFSGFLYYEALLGNQIWSEHSINIGLRMEL